VLIQSLTNVGVMHELCFIDSKLRVMSLLIFVCLMSACVTKPESQLVSNAEALVLPKRYDATAYPKLRIVPGLLQLFSDPRLEKWVKLALEHNPDLKLTAARLEEAGFNTRKAYAPSLPSLVLRGEGNRARARVAGNSNISNRYFSGVDVNWELDVWGRISSGISAAAADQEAANADYAAAKQSISAQTMQSYFDLVAADKLLALSNRRLSSFKKSYQLVDRRFSLGTGNLGDSDLAKTDLENTRAQVAQRKDIRDQVSRQLGALTGGYPDRSATKTSFGWPSLRNGVNSGIPSDLLKNRPDVDAAYHRIRAADSKMTVAHRDLFPRFTLTATGGHETSSLSRLINSNTSLWSLTSRITGPIFEGGNRRAELGAANARAKQAYATYQSTVINALREVENALGSERYLLGQETALQNALAAARRAENRIRRNYEAGLGNVLSLLESQRRSFNTEESLINTRALRYKNRVRLALALGTDA